jgi:hypothetical protein
MKRILVFLAAVGFAVAPLAARGRVTGSYVEARTAEVFTGGCVMASEAETMGREAVLAWKVDRGAFNGISIDGLSVVAALAGDRNLGIQEIGGDKPTVRSTVFVDEKANAAQRLALVSMATELSRGLLGTIVAVTPAPIEFADGSAEVAVRTNELALEVAKHFVHDPSCGSTQWFHPLSSIDDAVVGLASQHTFTGNGLGAKWSDPNKRSAFFGTFTY